MRGLGCQRRLLLRAKSAIRVTLSPVLCLICVISFVVPAHNEEACLPATLQAIHDAARATGQPYEVIVVNDASTDATPDVARQHGARVVDVNHRQIAATRNSGARAAQGDRIFFVDADTRTNARAVAAALRRMGRGAVGGGAPVVFDKDEALPFYVRWGMWLQVPLATAIGFTGGAFMFCTREAFQATGGFNERLFWAEEGDFVLALKREGKFTVLWTPVFTSGRRLRTTSGLKVITLIGRALLSPRKMFTCRASVQEIWYDSNRANDNVLRTSPRSRISNAIGLTFLLLLLSCPFWNFVPRSLTPLSSPLGMLRLVAGILGCHVGLILWPAAIILFINLLRQKRFAGSIHTMLLIAFCAWQAWDSTLGVMWVWGHVYHWLA